MLCLKALQSNRLIRFNRIALNITNQYMSRSDPRSRFKQLVNIDSDDKNRSIPLDQFVSDIAFRKDILQNVFTLSQNVCKGNRSLNELIDEKDLNQICELIHKNLTNLKNRELVNSLESFLVMGLDPNSKFVQSLENQMLWKAKELDLKDLLTCLSFHVRYQSTEQQIRVVNELIINLVLKLDNARNDNDIVQLLSLWRQLSPEIIDKIESMTFEMIGRSDEKQFQLRTLSYILVLLAKMNRRSKPLIKAVVNRFTYSPQNLNDSKPEFMIKMISALNQLNYIDIHFLKKSSDLLCNSKFLNTVRPSDRRDLLVAVSQSNWSYSRLLDEYIEKITDTNNDFSSQDFLVFVSSFARLYSHLSYLNEILYNYVIPYVKREDFDCESWLLYVWSLSILKCVPQRHIDSVLNNDFYNQLMGSSESNHKQTIFKLKLLNIKAVAEIELNESIHLESLSVPDYQMPKKELSNEKFKKSVLQLLSKFVDNIAANVWTPNGFSIDAEFIINKDLDSLSLQEFGLLSADPSNEVKALPEGYKRVALMSFGFNDQLLDGSGLIGVHELSVRLLKRLGYSVVAVKQNDISIDSRNYNRVESLKAIVNNIFE